MGFTTFVVTLVTFTITTLIGLAILVPFMGLVVRFRVNYNPRGLNLNPGGDSIGVTSTDDNDPRVGPRVDSLLAMFFRVRRIEGWKGFYKGFMPIFLYVIFNTLFSMLYIGASMKAPKGQYSIPRATMWQSFVYGVVMAFVSLPFSIITNRSITTPHKLSAFKPAASLRLLLTSYERRRPWTLYLTPGLFLAQFLHVFFVTVFSRLVRIILVPTLANGLEDAERDGKVSDISTIGLSIFILFQALGGTAILCPLEVMSARLTVQRNYTPGAEFEEEDAEINAVNEGGEAVEYAGRDEDVLNLRSHSGEEPYKGLRHCYQRMLEEEGVSALFRAWWLTMLGAVLSGFA